MPLTDLFTPEDRAFYDELTSWIDEHLPPFAAAVSSRHDVDRYVKLLKEWHRESYEGGWVGITWPPKWGGRGASASQKLILDFEMARRRAPEPMGKKGVDDVGPAIIVHGSQEQKEYFLPRILRGEWIWCQGFSEPDAGSDLASLSTRAVRCEDGYRITGQKVWTSNAYFADRIWLLARTEPAAPKQLGITAFVVDMQTPGISVRPIRQITGELPGKQPFNHQFNEVFLDDVFVPAFCRIGPENAGWTVAKTTLVQERAFRGQLGIASGSINALADLLSDDDVRVLYDEDLSGFEDRIIDFKVMLAGLEQLYERSVRSVLAGRATGSESSLVRLLGSELRQRAAALALDIGGPYGQLLAGSPEAFKRGNAAYEFLASRSATIASGTSEIQRNLIAEWVLGLPRASGNAER